MNEAVIWKHFARAVGKAFGIKHIRAARIDATMQCGVTEVTVTFLATEDQLKALAEALRDSETPGWSPGVSIEGRG